MNSDTITTSTTYEVGLEKPLPTGGSINLGLPLSDTDTNLSAGVAQAQATVSYVQSLMRGAGTRTNSRLIPRPNAIVFREFPAVCCRRRASWASTML